MRKSIPHNVLGMRCVRCNRQYDRNTAPQYICGCGGNLDVVYDYQKIRRRLTRDALARNPFRNVWRYLPILPLDEATPKRFPLSLVMSPLYKVSNTLYLKDDTRQPSASFKDRAGAVALGRALEMGAGRVSTASTGNAGVSLACLSASTRTPCTIFVPKTAPEPKRAQLALYGAQLVLVEGNYDNAYDLCTAACKEFGWYNRSTGYNPWTREGKKTCSLEICEQLGFNVPDWVFVPTGDGNMISGIWKGFKDFRLLGLIPRLPRLVCVQSSLSNAIAQAWRDKVKTPKAVSATTIADSISVDLPRDGDAAVRAINESGGFAVEVQDSEILSSISTLASKYGLFSEPAGATAYAGYLKASRIGKAMKPNHVSVCLVTGNGLKDIASALKACTSKPIVTPPNLAELKKRLR